MKAWWLVPVGALALAACVPDYAAQGDSNVILRITKISAQSGDSGTGSGTGDVLNSDVYCPIVNDNATITVQAISKNPSIGTGGQITGFANDVLVETYEVRYFRTDGRNQEGVDVPYRITGPVATQVNFTGSNSFTIVVVRHQAKSEPPLRNLVGVFSEQNTVQLPGSGILTVVAEITVRGHTTSGKAVEAQGSLQINFADFNGSSPAP
jgi:hypothetical protein